MKKAFQHVKDTDVCMGFVEKSKKINNNKNSAEREL